MTSCKFHVLNSTSESKVYEIMMTINNTVTKKNNKPRYIQNKEYKIKD